MPQTFLGVALALVAVAVASAFLLYGRGPRVRGGVFCVASLFAALIPGVLAWYAWAESRSLAWTAAYAAVGVAALAVCLRFGRKTARRSAA